MSTTESSSVSATESASVSASESSTESASVSSASSTGETASSESRSSQDASSSSGESSASSSAPVDAGSRRDASLEDASPRDAHIGFPDGSKVAVCESCLSSACTSDYEACEDDTNCTATINCVVMSGCVVDLAKDAGSRDGGKVDGGAVATLDACVKTCVEGLGLTPREEAMVAEEITALSQCAAPCVSECAIGDAAM